MLELFAEIPKQILKFKWGHRSPQQLNNLGKKEAGGPRKDCGVQTLVQHMGLSNRPKYKHSPYRGFTDLIRLQECSVGEKKIIFFTNASGSKEYTHLKRKKIKN